MFCRALQYAVCVEVRPLREAQGAAVPAGTLVLSGLSLKVLTERATSANAAAPLDYSFNRKLKVRVRAWAWSGLLGAVGVHAHVCLFMCACTHARCHTGGQASTERCCFLARRPKTLKVQQP